MHGFHSNIEDDTLANTNFRKVLYTGKNSQLVLMSLRPGEEIGEEIHAENDQFFRVEQGVGKCIIDGNEYELEDGVAIIVPAGAKHNLINTSQTEDLKLYTIYSPPHHKDQIVRTTKAEAEALEEDFDGVTSEDLYGQVVQFVNSTFKGKQVKHFERTVFWFEHLLQRPLTEPEKIAAYSHDIERGFRKPLDSNQSLPDYTGQDFLKHHQQEGAKIMAAFLTERDMNDGDIELVKHLIEKHEQGGDDLQNTLKYADSVSFFETNVKDFVEKKAITEGYERVRVKLDWMFDRTTSDVAKKVAEPFYQRWIKELESKYLSK